MEEHYQANNQADAFEIDAAMKEKSELTECAKNQMAFINLFLLRMWYDLYHSHLFNLGLRDKLIARIDKSKFSQYFNNLTLEEISMGELLPRIESASLPWQDELGLWVNLEIDYNGMCEATLKTGGLKFPDSSTANKDTEDFFDLVSSQKEESQDSDGSDSGEEKFVD